MQLLYKDDEISIYRSSSRVIEIQAKKDVSGPNDHGATVKVWRSGDGDLNVSTNDEMVVGTSGSNYPQVLVKRIG